MLRLCSLLVKVYYCTNNTKSILGTKFRSKCGAVALWVGLTSLTLERDWLPGCCQPVWILQHCSCCKVPWFPAGPRSEPRRKQPSSSLCLPRNWTRRRWCGLTGGYSRRRSRWAPQGRSSRTFPLLWEPADKAT